jgi:broad specificity phosphatase PhoE
MTIMHGRGRVPSVSGSLVLVRHGRPDMTDQRSDTWGLANDGIDAARRLGLSLRTVVSKGASTVVCSTEPKAVETAVAPASALSVQMRASVRSTDPGTTTSEPSRTRYTDT